MSSIRKSTRRESRCSRPSNCNAPSVTFTRGGGGGAAGIDDALTKPYSRAMSSGNLPEIREKNARNAEPILKIELPQELPGYKTAARQSFAVRPKVDSGDSRSRLIVLSISE